MAVSFTPLQLKLGLVHGDLRLVYSCSAMETHFMKLPILSYCADVASKGILDVCSECWNRGLFLHALHFSTRQSNSVSFCGLPLHGWAVVAPRHFHFTITALTFDQGSSSKAEIWTDLLERWHPMTVPRWKSLSPSSKDHSNANVWNSRIR